MVQQGDLANDKHGHPARAGKAAVASGLSKIKIATS